MQQRPLKGINVEIGARIKAERKAQKLTRERLAELLTSVPTEKRGHIVKIVEEIIEYTR